MWFVSQISTLIDLSISLFDGISWTLLSLANIRETLMGSLFNLSLDVYLEVEEKEEVLISWFICNSNKNNHSNYLNPSTERSRKVGGIDRGGADRKIKIVDVLVKKNVLGQKKSQPLLPLLSFSPSSIYLWLCVCVLCERPFRANLSR